MKPSDIGINTYDTSQARLGINLATAWAIQLIDHILDKIEKIG